MRLLLVLVFLIQLTSCKKESKGIHNALKERQRTVFKTDSVTVLKPKKELKKAIKVPIPPPPIPPPIPIKIVSGITIEPINCFDPNLDLRSAIELITLGTENTQWFVVEKKNVNYQHIKLDETDTIWMKKELLKLDWELMDSLQTNIGNQNKIVLKLKKGNRMCTVEKKLFLANKKNDNFVEEWFEIAIIN